MTTAIIISFALLSTIGLFIVLYENMRFNQALKMYKEGCLDPESPYYEMVIQYKNPVEL